MMPKTSCFLMVLVNHNLSSLFGWAPQFIFAFLVVLWFSFPSCCRKLFRYFWRYFAQEWNSILFLKCPSILGVFQLHIYESLTYNWRQHLTQLLQFYQINSLKSQEAFPVDRIAHICYVWLNFHLSTRNTLVFHSFGIIKYILFWFL